MSTAAPRLSVDGNCFHNAIWPTIIRSVNMWMDHQKGDTLIGTPLHAGDEALQPSSYLLRDKIR